MKDLDSYLNDHLAGSISALEVIDHWAEAHKGEPLGNFFAQIETEVKADQETLRDIMRTLGIEESKVRKAGAWGRKAGPRTIDSCRQRTWEFGIGADVGRINHGNYWEETNVGCAGSGEIYTVKQL